MSAGGVSVVVPVRDGERYLGAAIESALAQRPSEVIVVDDGSRDGSAALARGFGEPVRVVSQPARGIAAARNRGVAESAGEYVAFLDADDRWTPDAITAQLRAFAYDEQLELVFGHVREFISPELDEHQASQMTSREALEPGYLVGAVLIRSATLARVGSFNEQLVTGDFVDWMTRAHELGVREALIPEHVLWRRVHTSNHGRLHADARADYARLLKWALDRRRRAAASGD